mmetsp:Transcript_23359/g.72781  ORF Transcript_23359/g.72781 Transcript_23359/m.72781 type:complete len:226 (+) Transcript_23359:340-1017(+)
MGNWDANPVFLLVVVWPLSLQVGEQRGTEDLLAHLHGLQRDVLFTEDGHSGAPRQGIRRTVHVQCPLPCMHLTSVQEQALLAHLPHVAQTHHTVHALQLGKLSRAHCCTTEGLRPAGLVQSHENPDPFVGQELRVSAVQLGRLDFRFHGLHLCRDCGGSLNNAPRLDVCAVEQPGVARHDPEQPLWRDTVPEEPEHRVDARLARANDHVQRVRAGDRGQAVRGHN